MSRRDTAANIAQNKTLSSSGPLRRNSHILMVVAMLMHVIKT